MEKGQMLKAVVNDTAIQPQIAPYINKKKKGAQVSLRLRTKLGLLGHLHLPLFVQPDEFDATTYQLRDETKNEQLRTGFALAVAMLRDNPGVTFDNLKIHWAAVVDFQGFHPPTTSPESTSTPETSRPLDANGIG